MPDESLSDDFLRMIDEMKAKMLATRAKFMDRFRTHLYKMSVPEMKEYLKDVPDGDLQFMCDTFLPNEDYEICQAVYELIEERKKISN